MNENLLNAIRGVQRKIKSRRTYYSGDEERTTRGLVDPILNALGWDIHNPDLVEHQSRLDSKRVDIALLHEKKRIALIDAKKLGTRLDNHIDQLRDYWSRYTTKTAILTDGKIWQIYRPLLLGRSFSESKLFEIKLGEDADSARIAASQLGKLARDGIDQQLELEEWHLILNEAWNKHEVVLLDKIGKSLHRFFKKQINNDKVPIKSVRAFLHEKMGVEIQNTAQVTRPRKPKIQSFEVKNNTEALIKVVEWLVENRYLTCDDCPIKRGGRSNYLLIHSKEQHPDWSPFSQKKNLPNGFFIDTHGDSKEMIRLAKMLLENHAPSYKPEDLIRFSS